MTRFFDPADLANATAALAEHTGHARVIAGGTDLVVQARSGRRPLPEVLVALDRLDLRGVTSDAGVLRLGATTTHADLLASVAVRQQATAVSDGAALIGSPATRAVGTVGGNLGNASPALDLGAGLMVLGAVAHAASHVGSRAIAVEDLLVGPNRTSLEPDEVLTHVDVPPAGSQRGASGYVRLGYRKAMEISVVGCAAYLELDDASACIESRIVLGAVAPRPERARACERALLGRELTDEVLAAAAAASIEHGSPISDVRASSAYRRGMIPVVVRRALTLARSRLPEEGSA